MSNTVLNAFSCVANTANTGFTSCSYTPGLIEACILVPKGTEFSTAQIIDFQTTLQTGLSNNTKTSRYQIIKQFVGMEDKSSEGVYESTGYGGNRKIRNGKYIWEFEYIKGGGCLHKKISTLDNKQDTYDVLWVDTENNCILGTLTESGALKGFTLEMIDVPNFKINTGAADTKFHVQFAMQNPKEMNLSWGIVNFENSVNLITTLDSLIDTELSVNTAMTSLGLVKLNVKDSCGGTDLTATYGNELDTIGLWTVTRLSTGNAITVSSATYSASTGTIDLDLDSSDSDYAAGQLCKISLGSVSAMVAAGILGHANAEIIVTMG